MALIHTTIDRGDVLCNAISLSAHELKKRKCALRSDAMKFLDESGDDISYVVYYHDSRDEEGHVIHATLHYNMVGLTKEEFEERSKHVTGEIGEVHRIANKTYVTWGQVEAFVHDICNKYKDSNLKGVYGLPRGGLIFAVMISHKLHIPMLASPCKGCLIVDDICDSGESLVHYRKNSSGHEDLEYNIATMYYKENKLGIVPDCYFETKEDKWIVFPWEADNE